MGYRSHVVIAMREEIVADFLTLMAINEEVKELCITEMKSDAYSKGDLLVELNNVKWYDCYPEVKALERFMGAQDNKNYRFLRAGESGEDMTEEGDYFADSLYVWQPAPVIEMT
jgi:hypothetical protein